MTVTVSTSAGLTKAGFMMAAEDGIIKPPWMSTPPGRQKEYCATPAYLANNRPLSPAAFRGLSRDILFMLELVGIDEQ